MLADVGRYRIRGGKKKRQPTTAAPTSAATTMLTPDAGATLNKAAAEGHASIATRLSAVADHTIQNVRLRGTAASSG